MAAQTIKNRRILIVDDNRAIHDDFRKILTMGSAVDAKLGAAAADIFGPVAETSYESFEIEFACQGQEGLEKIRTALAAGMPYALAFIDMRMPPGWDGLETISQFWNLDSEIQVVLSTAYSDHSWDEITQKLGRVDRFLILKKPFDPVEVRQLAYALTQKWDLARQASLKLNEMQSMVEEKTRSLTAEIAQRREKEAALRLAEERYSLAVAGANDGIWDWDIKSNTVFYSPRWKAMLGYENEKFSSPDEWLNRIHPDDVDQARAQIEAHLKGQNDQLYLEYRMLHRDGEFRWVLCRGVAVRDAGGAVQRAAGSLTDITERKIAEDRFRHDALHDSLTGVANRTMMMVQINQCLERTRRATDANFAVLFIDLDRFKLINDTLGHEAGDKLLVETAKRLGSTVRSMDMVARWETDHLARLGGDEFVLLLDCIKTPVEAVRIAERLIESVSKPISIMGHDVSVAASIGIAISSPAYQRAQDILRDADTALYRAKREDKGNCRIFDPGMHDAATKRLWMESELRRAVDASELTLHYQPIISVATGRIVALEALVRWRNPEHGLVMPGDFIPLAEETGHIVSLGKWVIEAACRQMGKWKSQSPEFADVAIAVNCSGKQLIRQKFVGEVSSILSKYGLPPHHLKLEITEGVVIQNGENAIASVNGLRHAGIPLHLDDFGTGYSSLSYLTRLPVEVIKIDRSFVGAMTTDQAAESVVQAIITLAHSLRVKVTAEGVETAQQLERLRRLGCDFVQGYFFAKPMPEDEVTAFVAQQLDPNSVDKEVAEPFQLMPAAKRASA